MSIKFEILVFATHLFQSAKKVKQNKQSFNKNNYDTVTPAANAVSTLPHPVFKFRTFFFITRFGH